MNKKIYLPAILFSVILTGCTNQNTQQQEEENNKIKEQGNNQQQNNNKQTNTGNNQQNNIADQQSNNQSNTGNNTKTVNINEVYQDPYGEDEKLNGNIKLSDGIIKKVEIKDKEAFNDYADENLVGKELAELEEVDVVSDASKTSRAFNKFLQEYSN